MTCALPALSAHIPRAGSTVPGDGYTPRTPSPGLYPAPSSPWEQYEHEKAELRERGLSAEDYERELGELARRLGL